MLTFTTTHFSTYAVGYNKTEFSDVSGWAEDAITFLSARGIISGKTKEGENASYFAPQDNATRAEAAQMLATLIKGMLK